jgi:uncharacterized protein YhfF
MASLNADMERRCVELLTLTGHESVVDDIPVAVIAVDSVEVLPFARVAWEFADAEGEGFESIEDWRSGHLGFGEARAWPYRTRRRSSACACASTSSQAGRSRRRFDA